MCRLCRGEDLRELLHLGEQSLTGVFPRSGEPDPSKGPLTLVQCAACGLVQLRQSYDLGELYGNNYGYRSGLNRSMVEHLGNKVAALRRIVEPGPGDLVLDIGCNDGTTLSFYPAGAARLAGFDPSAEKFRGYYRPDVSLVVDFFSAERFFTEFGDRARARIVTSIAMFYDLENPVEFMRQVAAVLAEDGIWHFEQSYLPLMLETNAYDTVCHEHLEYYGAEQIRRMADEAGLKILSLEKNAVNGGSFAVTAAKIYAPHAGDPEGVAAFLDEERKLGLDGPAPFETFKKRVERHRAKLCGLLAELKSQGRLVLGYGASTKGNVILQYCGVTADLLPAIAEVNEYKFGRVTPGSRIPIVSEAEAKAMKPDYFLVLPWHFRDNILMREREYLKAGGKLLFPLPEIEIVGA